MKRLWERYCVWFEARRERERWIVALAVVIGVAALIDGLLLSPASARRAAAERGLSTLQGQIRDVQSQLTAVRRAQAVDPNAAVRSRIETLRREVEELDRGLHARSGEFVTPQRVRALLDRVLAGRPGLQLVELRSLDPVPVQDPAVPAAAGSTATSPGAVSSVLFRHGLQIAVRGRYAELVDYLRELENLPVRVFWGRIDLVAENWPDSVVRITLHTLSLERTWIAV